jgi:putative Mg2+ transporter-C (MgtC) family protein
MGMIIELQILANTAIAMLLGGIIGYEREIADKPAGLRTHMLVAGVAAFLVQISIHLVQISNLNIANQSLIQTDPIRVMEAIITGLSFIGAGSIIQRTGEEKVHGLTTAGTLLFVGSIGIGVALSLYYLSIGATLFVLFVNRIMSIFERKFLKKDKE